LSENKEEMPMSFGPVSRRMLVVGAAIITPLLATISLASAQSANRSDSKVHRLAIHVDDNNPGTMNLALNNAQNVTQYYTGKGEEIEIEVVAYGPGLHMLRADTSPKQVQGRLKSFSESMPNIKFMACEVTRGKMAKAEGKKPADIPLVKFAKSVPSGVVHLIGLQEKGWSYIKP
jgi:intracellular sulfur oxidation DsrE/DsrF family protein